MVSINIGAGQGITQAIATKLGIKGQDLKKISLSTWQNVMTEVNNAQSQIDKHNAANPSDKQKSIFTGGRDVNTINQKSAWQNNFVVQQGSVEINESSWNKIVQLLTGKKADVTSKDIKPEANPVDVNKSPVSLSSDIPDSAKNIDIPASIKRAGTESMLDSIGGKIIERSVNGEKQEIAVVEINGQKVRRAINEDGSLGDTIAATKTFGKNEYISGEFPAETKILERLVDGKKQQIGVYEDENGNKVRKLVTTDPETGKTTLGENLVTVSTMGKNKYVTESKFNADVKTMLGLGQDEDIPADLKAEYITIGGESSIVIKKDGKVMDSAQIKAFMSDYRAQQNPVDANNDSSDKLNSSNTPEPKNLRDDIKTLLSNINNLQSGQTLDFVKQGSDIQLQNGELINVPYENKYTVTKNSNGDIELRSSDNSVSLYSSDGKILSETIIDDNMFLNSDEFGKITTVNNYKDNTQTLNFDNATLTDVSLNTLLSKLSKQDNATIYGKDGILFTSELATTNYNIKTNEEYVDYKFKDINGNALTREQVINLLKENNLSKIMMKNAFDLNYINEHENLQAELMYGY